MLPLFRVDVDPPSLLLEPLFDPVVADLPPDLAEVVFALDAPELFDVEVELARPFDLAELRDEAGFDREAEPFELPDARDFEVFEPAEEDFDLDPPELEVDLPVFEEAPEADLDDDEVLFDEPDLPDREEELPLLEVPLDPDFADLEEPPDADFPDLDELPVADLPDLDDPPDEDLLEPEVLFEPAVFLVDDPDLAEPEPDFEPVDFFVPDPDFEPEDFFFDEDDFEAAELFAVAIFFFPRIILCF